MNTFIDCDDMKRIDQAIHFLEMFIQIDGENCIGLTDVLNTLKHLKNKSRN